MRQNPRIHKLLLGIFTLMLLGQAPLYSYEENNYNRLSNLGISYIENQEYAKAIEVLTNALQQAPKRGDIRNNLAAACIRMAVELNNSKQDYEDALKMMRTSIYYLKYDAPKNAEYSNFSDKNLNYAEESLEKLYTMQRIPHATKEDFMVLANKLRLEGDLKGAIVEYAYAIQKDVNDKALYIQLGTLYNVLKNYDRAVGAYEVVFNKFDGNGNKQLMKDLAKLYANTNQYSLATDFYFKARDLDKNDPDIPTQLMALWGNLIAKSPQDNALRFEYGNVLQKLNRYTDALQQYNVVSLRDPQNIESKINIGIIYQNLGKYNDAIDIYNQALTMNPGNIDAHYYKGLALAKLKRPEEAKNEFMFVKRLKPDYPNIDKQLEDANVINSYYKQALDQHKKEQYNDAIENYKKAKLQDPENYEININLGLAYEGIKDYASAIQEYRIVAEHNPQLALVYSMLGNAYKLAQDYPSAQTNYSKALSLEPNNADYKKSLQAVETVLSGNYLKEGLELYENKHYEQAKQVIQNGLAVDPHNPDGYYYLGLIYDAQGNTKEAIQNYQKATLQDSNYYSAYYALAIAYDLLNDTPKAKEAYQKFVAKAPSSEAELITYSKSRLQELQ